VKHWLAILAALSASIALADDFKTVNGKEYKNVAVSRVEADGLVLRSKSGISKVYFTELPRDVQERFHYVDPAKAEAERLAAIEKNRTEQRAGKEGIARAILSKTQEQFAVAETQGAHAYEASEKGTLSGQTFVATNGRENIKLGAQYIALFSHDGVNTLVDGLRAFATAKSEELQVDVSAAEDEENQAKLAEKQAEAAAEQAKEAGQQARAAEKSIIGRPRASDTETAIFAAREAGIASRRDQDAAKEAESRARNAAEAARAKIEALSEEKDYYRSDAFLFSYLRPPIQIGETDAEGKFTIQVPRTGKWVIAAHAKRMTLNDKIEYYYWLQPVSLGGQQAHVQNLNNNNLTRGATFLSDEFP
jgi:hypothetical protein